MLASQLPFEIIRNIAHFLSTSDRSQASLCCRAWQIPLQESMWTHMSLDDNQAIKRICEPGSLENTMYRRFGHHVHTLQIDTFEMYSNLLGLQSLLPNVRQIRAQFRAKNGEVFQKAMYSEDAIDCNLWKSLTDLSITLKYSYLQSGIGDFYPIIYSLHGLKSLSLDQDCFVNRLALSFDRLEVLHANLPRLEELHINTEPLAIYPEKLQGFCNLTPAAHISVLDMRIKHSVQNWLYYLAIKYPNLRVLKTLYFTNEFSKDYNHLNRNLLNVPSAFQELQQLNVKIIMSALWGYLDVWKQFGLVARSVKRMHYEIDQDTNSQDGILDLVKSCMESFSSTLESITVITHFPCNIHLLTSSLGYYPKLVDIHIAIVGITIELDMLLDRCPALEKLSTYESTVCLNNTSASSKKHGLCMLVLRKGTIDVGALNYLSIRCRSLDHMAFLEVGITGDISQKTGNICAHMPFTHFKVLWLLNVRFHVLNNQSTNIIALSRHTQDPFPTLQQNRSDSKKGPKELLWFYITYKEDELYSKNNVQRLDKTEAKQAGKYFRNYQHQKAMDQTNCSEPDNTKEAWKTYLPNGHGTIECGSIAEYYLDGYLDKDYYRLHKLFNAS
ncbi:hypothetical protein CLU79DRAFT_839515 [Phycomyces nitens]|nr:hypothetical protein CLU79DRAFT_839515 [Phycomyces nitens]